MGAVTTLANKADRARRPDWVVVLAIWAVAALVLLVRAQFQPSPLLGDADDAMRTIEAIDLLNGQAWHDYTQYRDNTPYGASMHWSRLIDAPIAVIMFVVSPLAGAAAPRIAAMIWPVLLLLPMMALTLALTRRLVPTTDTSTPLVLPLVSLVLLVEFIPGRTDHHNVQILLCLIIALSLVAGRERISAGIVAGLAGATSLAIGMETLPILAVATAAFVLLWVGDPRRFASPLAGFGLALGGGALAHQLLASAPADYFVPACDALSVVYVVPALIGGTFLAGGAVLCAGLTAPWQRLALMATLGAISVGTAAALFPHCLAGPYEAVKAVMPHYFDDIGEALPLWVRTVKDPAIGVGFALAVLAAIPVTAGRVWRETGTRRIDWAIILAMLVMSSVVMILQIRGARIAAPFAVPAAAFVIAGARAAYLRRRDLPRAAVMIGAWLTFAGVAHYAIIVTLLPPSATAAIAATGDGMGARRLSCVDDAAYERLAALPAGRVIVPFRLGPHVLVNTHHAVVATGFHRNTQGMLDTEAFFAGNEAAAEQVAVERGLDYVVLCPLVLEYDLPVGPTAGEHWSWLSPISGPGEPLVIYAINRPPPRP